MFQTALIRPSGLCLGLLLITSLLAGPGVRAGILEADVEAAISKGRSLLAVTAPALAPLAANGTFEPNQPEFYVAKQEAIKDAFRVNETFFANLNKTDVPAIEKITNGTFEIKPVVAAGGSRIESANTDGERCNGLPTRSRTKSAHNCRHNVTFIAIMVQVIICYLP